jgi:hypothetical protein
MATLGRRFSFVALPALLEACSGATGAVSPTDDGDTRIATVQSAMSQPTGAVSPSSVRALAPDWLAFQQAMPAFDALLSVDAATAQACLTGATESGPVAEYEAGAGGGPLQSGTYELGCLTAGKVLGRLSVRLEPQPAQGQTETDAGVVQRLEVQLQDACTGDACVSADAFASIAPKAPLGCAPSVTFAVTATVTVSGASRTFSFGAQGGVGRSELAGVTVYFDDEGRSLSVQSGEGAAPEGPVLVSGAGQSFECTLAPAGGRCDGVTSFMY